ncbi:UMP-CMP kinase 2, mitochondrial isoform X2 [Carettochelys insculpta]|uniref:UMP-CMP kinase 2, mitochondrial isoform X2 n=1 Tax=Carettochelys insculpta TaxID=44489 RepID=UPI003EBCE794
MVAAPPGPCFAVEGAGPDLIHFTLCSEGAAQAPEPRCFLPAPAKCYSLCVPATPSVPAARLHRRLQQSLRQGPFARCRLLGLLCYSSGRGAPAAVEKGFLIQDPQGGPETERALEDLLRSQGEQPPPPLGVYEAGERGELWQSLWALRRAGGRELLRRAQVVAAEEPPLHPAVSSLRSAAVFHCLEAARGVVEQCTSLIPEAKAVLDLVDKCPKHSKKGKFPVIVIEGLDATGKTTVTQSVKESLNALLLRSPPTCISSWRKTFDDEPTLIRRAFYALGNYIVASEIAKASTKSPVIVDRVEESYKRMENPTCKEVDASPSREEVLRTVLHLIKNHCGSL